jgi:hypothetical protein
LWSRRKNSSFRHFCLFDSFHLAPLRVLPLFYDQHAWLTANSNNVAHWSVVVWTSLAENRSAQVLFSRSRHLRLVQTMHGLRCLLMSSAPKFQEVTVLPIL